MELVVSADSNFIMMILTRQHEVSAKVSEYRVVREYPNPNYWVPEISGSGFSGLNSGNVFHYPNFLWPELADPKKSGNPNAQG